jgi:hypothetical protein
MYIEESMDPNRVLGRRRACSHEIADFTEFAD